jgi:hypothetical protein
MVFVLECEGDKKKGKKKLGENIKFCLFFYCSCFGTWRLSFIG